MYIMQSKLSRNWETQLLMLLTWSCKSYETNHALHTQSHPTKMKQYKRRGWNLGSNCAAYDLCTQLSFTSIGTFVIRKHFLSCCSTVRIMSLQYKASSFARLAVDRTGYRLYCLLFLYTSILCCFIATKHRVIHNSSEVLDHRKLVQLLIWNETMLYNITYLLKYEDKGNAELRTLFHSYCNNLWPSVTYFILQESPFPNRLVELQKSIYITGAWRMCLTFYQMDNCLRKTAYS